MSWELLVIAQYGITAVSSAFNATYFGRYRSPRAGRWIAARVLAVASLALVLESAYFGIYLFASQRLHTDARAWLLAGSLSAIGSLLMTGLILRQMVNHRS